jgi:hypothetical protein
MIRYLFTLIIFCATGASSRAQVPVPSPERFVNIAFSLTADSIRPHYFLIAGADTCRFVKYDYDELSKSLLEPVPISILNELAEKVYHSDFHHLWNKDSLTRAICVTRRQADSILAHVPPAGDTSHVHDIFSFSLPQFTDDGNYAVIDLNIVCGSRCGMGSTCFFRRTASGWKFIGMHFNWYA